MSSRRTYMEMGGSPNKDGGDWLVGATHCDAVSGEAPRRVLVRASAQSCLSACCCILTTRICADVLPRHMPGRLLE